MKRPALVHLSVLGLAALLTVSGCGRSNLLGNGGVEACPAGQTLGPKGSCIAVADMAMPHPDGFVPPGDDGFIPPGDDGFIPPGDDGFIPPGDDGFIPPNNDGMLPPGEDFAGLDLAGGCMSLREICNNGIDDNCNGLTDCQDPGCAGDPSCFVLGHEICNNGIDDDHNGLTDCQDPACVNFPGCQMHVCDPNHPNCADPQCNQVPQCQDLVCMPTVDFGTLQKNGSKSEKAMSTVGTMDVTLTPCAPPGGGMVVTRFTVASDNTAVQLSFTQDPNADHVFGLFFAGILQACGANPDGCYDPMGMPSGKTSWVLAAGEYYLIVQAHEINHQGSVDVILTTPPVNVMEICDNGIDDDMNGLTDCADPACFNSPFCKMSECKPDINVGSLVVGDPPKMVTFNTVGQGSKYKLQCTDGKGQDVAVEFSLPVAAGVLTDTDSNGWHAVELYKLPGPGENCDAIPIADSCYLPVMQGLMHDEVAWGDLNAGSYIFVFQAVNPGDEGQVNLRISAYSNRKVELCHNGIDDDNNGFTDCADPACFNDPGCGAPVCVPDIDLGTLQLGQQAMATVDLTKGILNEVVSCAKGGGKASVIQVTLAQEAALGVDCDQPSGQAVVGLFAPGGVRDACDKNEENCGDPKTLPFGCNYEIPNLQPGVYYVILEAFQAGDEGTVNITLSSIQDIVLEICNNGIDDDMNGFTDCQDKKCATYPACILKECMPDASIDPMPIGGNSEVFKLLQTTPQKTSTSPTCETKPGGGDAVIYINMPGPGTLNASYVQGGNANHVFALYPDLGDGLVCDSAKAIQCTPSGGAQAGKLSYPNLLAGMYWFVAAATQPGDEGGVALTFTATP